MSWQIATNIANYGTYINIGSGAGTGTVGTGVATHLPYYATSGDALADAGVNLTWNGANLLTITGNVQTSGLRFSNISGVPAATTGNINIRGDTTGNSPGGTGVYFNNNSSTVMGTPVAEFTFDETGNDELRVAGDIIAYETTSDKRLKNNIKPLSNSLKKIIQIGGYEFDWNENQNTYSGHDVGIIAQEIEEVLPEAVETRANGYKAVQYKKIIPLLIEGMKDQQKQIDELKELVNKLIEKDANNS